MNTQNVISMKEFEEELNEQEVELEVKGKETESQRHGYNQGDTEEQLKRIVKSNKKVG